MIMENSSWNIGTVSLISPLIVKQIQNVGRYYIKYHTRHSNDGQGLINSENSTTKVTDQDLDIFINVDYLRSLDPKEWQDQDHYAVLGLKSHRYNASDDDIKRAYRKIVLKHHPDKRKAQEEEIKTEDDYFTCITRAYETLGGGSGFIGRRLVKLLASNGYNITIISRMPGLNHMTWHDLENVGIPETTTAVVNLAGQNVLDPSKRWTAGFKQIVWNSRINSTTSIVRAIKKTETKPEVFINISGVSVYRPDPNKTYMEDDNCVESFDFMSKLCIEWERAASIPSDVKCRNVKLRTGVVLGREGGMVKSLILPFWLGFGGKIASGNQSLPWIHIDDLCNLIKFSMENQNVEGILNGVAPDIITNETFAKTFASTMLRPALIPLPKFAIDIIFGKERGALLTDGPKIQPKRVLDYGFQYKYTNIKSACKDVSNFF